MSTPRNGSMNKKKNHAQLPHPVARVRTVGQEIGALTGGDPHVFDTPLLIFSEDPVPGRLQKGLGANREAKTVLALRHPDGRASVSAMKAEQEYVTVSQPAGTRVVDRRRRVGDVGGCEDGVVLRADHHHDVSSISGLTILR